MIFKDTIKIALTSLLVNKSRSALTMLGIIIGVGSVVLMTSVGKSMEGVILGQVSSLGAKTLAVFPGIFSVNPSNFLPGYDSLKESDADALKKLTTITDISPVMLVRGDAVYGRETVTTTTLGSNPAFFENQTVEIELGRKFDETDNEAARAVAVIGSDIKNNLFDNQNPLGKRIKISNRSYTVIGVARPIGSQFFQNADERIYIPLKTAIIATGQKHYDYITMKVTADPELAKADVISLLRQLHNIDNPENDPDKDDFNIRTSQQARQILGAVSLGLTLFITFVAAISLLVGGIGIMNIMLVSVTERTSEIGLRKALGATGKNILFQFLTESILLTFTGGFFGTLLSITFAYLIAIITNNYLPTYGFAMSYQAILFAQIIAISTGLLFGIYPARQAALLNPINALRYE